MKKVATALIDKIVVHERKGEGYICRLCVEYDTPFMVISLKLD